MVVVSRTQSVKTVHPITGSNFEGVGIKSDVIAGKGKWEGVRGAQKVGCRLARPYLKPEKKLYLQCMHMLNARDHISALLF
jgi:hypothetical protein